MHRSGTSLVAGFLHESGIDMGNRLIGASHGNVYGHFEDADFVDFHSAILEREQWDMWRAKELPSTRPQDAEKAKRLLRERNSKPLWGWKDPRTCLFLAFWNDLCLRARFLMVVRSPTEVVDSLRRRDGGEDDYWLSNTLRLHAWLLHTRACLRFKLSHPNNAAVVILDRVLADPAAFSRFLTEWVGVDFSSNELVDRINPRAIHQSVSWSLIKVMPHKMLSARRLYRNAQQAASF